MISFYNLFELKHFKHHQNGCQQGTDVRCHSEAINGVNSPITAYLTQFNDSHLMATLFRISHHSHT